ncbi:hypothetical protein BCR44DRAFT_35058 [Catenaria anguillulae PL171]|uniref:Fringe-like glycosyltransferase domain-containing protein n=1 Tax=Catenaria anguillulae PL171 TaxID=765915 RepID=A0A1Y2HEC9_9FUNG|nr:hypothetical protein BCR44DRAFT_35058 [Catenaria anguillulae PL171]
MPHHLAGYRRHFGSVRPLVARACLTAALTWSIILVAPSIGHLFDSRRDLLPVPSGSTYTEVSSHADLPRYNHNYEAWDFSLPLPPDQPPEVHVAPNPSQVVQAGVSPIHIAAIFLLAQAIGQLISSDRTASSGQASRQSESPIDPSLLLAPLSATIVAALFSAVASTPVLSLLALLLFRILAAGCTTWLECRSKTLVPELSNRLLLAALVGILALPRITDGSSVSWVGATLLVGVAVMGRVITGIVLFHDIKGDTGYSCSRRGSSAMASSAFLILAILSKSASAVPSITQSLVLVSLAVLSVALGESQANEEPSSLVFGASVLATDAAVAAAVHFMNMPSASPLSHAITFGCLYGFSILSRFVFHDNPPYCSENIFQSGFSSLQSRLRNDSNSQPKLRRAIPAISLLALVALLYVPSTQRLASRPKLATRSTVSSPIFTTYPSSLPPNLHKELLLASINSKSPRGLGDSISKPDILMTLMPFPALGEPDAPTDKAARPFWANSSVSVTTITVDRVTGVNQPMERVKKDQEQWITGVPTVDKWPERPLWPSSTSFGKSAAVASPTRAHASLDTIRFGIGSTPDRMDRIAFLYATLGRIPKLNFTLFWTAEDDPDVTLVPHASFAMRAAYRLSGRRARWPVVLQGEPNYVGRSLHRKWFKMVSHLYETAPENVQWFAVGDDDTMWLPHVMVDALNKAPKQMNPSMDFVYLGDLTEPLREQRQYGTAQAYGGAGVVMSRALARRVHKYWRACMAGVGRDVWYGDVLLSKCIAYVTSPEIDDLERNEAGVTSHQVALAAGYAKLHTAASTQGASTHLTRLPTFNQVDLHEWWPGAMDYFSARFSRAPPATLHHLDRLLPMMARSPNKHYAMLDFWHLMMRMPPQVMFRRFLVNLPAFESKRNKRTIPARTAVVTHGLHVRVYAQPLESTAHAVDFDSKKLSHDDGFVGLNWILEQQVKSSDSLPRARDEFTDYWIEAYDFKNDRLVYVDEEQGKRLAVGVTCALDVGKGSVTNLCSPTLVGEAQAAIVDSMAEWQSQVHVWELEAAESQSMSTAGRPDL